MISKQLNKNIILKRIYSARFDGFQAEIFHKKCDNKGPTLTLIKNEYDFIFGGYAYLSWNSKDMYGGTVFRRFCNDVNAFLFQLSPKNKIILQKINNNGVGSVMHDGSRMCVFGKGPDLDIRNSCNQNSSNVSCPHTYSFKTHELIGKDKSHFRVYDIETFSVMDQDYPC